MTSLAAPGEGDDGDDSAPGSPAESLRLIEVQRTAAVRSLRPDPLATFGSWGVAWFVGFGLLFLRFGPHDRVFVALPEWLPITVLYALMIAAGLVSGRAGMRATRHLNGQSRRDGRRYGLSWLAAYLTVVAAATRVSDLLPPAETGLLWAGLSVGMVGVLYLAGSAIWQARDMFVMGLWLTVINLLGILSGPGWHSLIICLGGGGGMVVGGVVARRVLARRTL